MSEKKEEFNCENTLNRIRLDVFCGNLNGTSFQQKKTKIFKNGGYFENNLPRETTFKTEDVSPSEKELNRK